MSVVGRCCRKVRDILLERNNRIIRVDFLNRTCAIDPHFESICAETLENLFATASVTGCLPEYVGTTTAIS